MLMASVPVNKLQLLKISVGVKIEDLLRFDVLVLPSKFLSKSFYLIEFYYL